MLIHMSGIFSVILFFGGLFWIGAALGAAADARENGEGAIKWFIIILMTGIFGVIWYLFAHIPARRSYDDSHTIHVSAEVEELETGNRIKYSHSVNTNSTTDAIDTFREKCETKGVKPVTKPTVDNVETGPSLGNDLDTTAKESSNTISYVVLGFSGALAGLVVGLVLSGLLSFILPGILNSAVGDLLFMVFPFAGSYLGAIHYRAEIVQTVRVKIGQWHLH